MKRIYVVNKHISSPFLGKIRWITDKRYVKDLKFSREQRDRIIAIRNQTRWPIDRHSVLFYGLRLTNTPEPIEEIIRETDRKLKKIDPSLAARVMMIPIDEEQIRKGELIGKLCYAIIYKIVSQMGRRVLRLKRDVFSQRSIDSLNAMLDDCSRLNFLDDPKVKEEIANLRSLLKLPTSTVKEKILEKTQEVAEELDVKVSPRVQRLIEEMNN